VELIQLHDLLIIVTKLDSDDWLKLVFGGADVLEESIPATA
jgi:hypothetical protein